MKNMINNSFASRPFRTQIKKNNSEICASTRTASTGVSAQSNDAHIRDMKRFPILSEEKQAQLFAEFKETGDVKVRNLIVASNMGLVYSIIRSFSFPLNKKADIIQAGYLGLIKAVEKYDSSRGAKFSTCAWEWMRAYMVEFIKNTYGECKIATTAQDRKCFSNIRRLQNKYHNLTLQEQDEKIAEDLKVSVKHVTEMRQRMTSSYSDSFPVLERMAAPGLPADEIIDTERKRALLHERLQDFRKLHLSDTRTLFLIDERLLAEKPMTLQEIGDKFKCTRERIRQIETKLMKDLREFLGKYENYV